MQFTDLTAFEPTYWHWDFGDAFAAVSNQTSEERNPVHTYEQPGVYQVCLRAGNDYGADSICREVRVLPESVAVEELTPGKWIHTAFFQTPPRTI